jgi:hypothetical protein
MYPIETYQEYTTQKIQPEDVVLVWSKSTGYCFLKFSQVNNSFKVVGVEK